MHWSKSIATRIFSAQLSWRHLCRNALACSLLIVANAGFGQQVGDVPKTTASRGETAEGSPESTDDSNRDPGDSVRPAYRNELLRGKVDWLAGALKDGFGISSVPEAATQSLAIVVADGRIIPLVENLRGRAFRKDKRLRDLEVELLVRRYEQHPLAQVLRVFEIRDEKRYEIDYWCDICAIPMYETGPCSCCQDDNRLRRRLVPDAERRSLETSVRDD